MLARWTRFVVTAALLTGCGAVGCGAQGATPVSGLDALPERYRYEGEVAIEPVALEELLERFVRLGCQRLPEIPTSVGEPAPSQPTGPSLGCAVALREESRPPRRRLIIYPEGPHCFGPCSFHIEGHKLYAFKDFEGPRYDEGFKRMVRADVRRLGNLVKIVEGTWSIQAHDARGVLY
ncbi:hypothetical protein WME89_29935 [Sorangium sp. So ce321]|uniref:hypothetical protein n=1 Tax=Sorangium sp. So ce321 TaxID=3133300 RepID=UPI003F63DE8C